MRHVVFRAARLVASFSVFALFHSFITHLIRLFSSPLLSSSSINRSTMDSPTAAVIIASVQSVAKVYVIGAVGFFSVKCTSNLLRLDLFRRMYVC
jgi:hypothetical protein